MRSLHRIARAILLRQQKIIGAVGTQQKAWRQQPFNVSAQCAIPAYQTASKPSHRAHAKHTLSRLVQERIKYADHCLSVSAAGIARPAIRLEPQADSPGLDPEKNKLEENRS
jgi:hypothetical protein